MEATGSLSPNPEPVQCLQLPGCQWAGKEGQRRVWGTVGAAFTLHLTEAREWGPAPRIHSLRNTQAMDTPPGWKVIMTDRRVHSQQGQRMTQCPCNYFSAQGPG